jgi:hypothetical protein
MPLFSCSIRYNTPALGYNIIINASISISHEGQNPPLLGALSALVKDSRQFKQREKRLLKVVTVNLQLYKQLEY